jgi:hypothetical protein
LSYGRMGAWIDGMLESWRTERARRARRKEWSPDEVMLPGLPDVSRPLYF